MALHFRWYDAWRDIEFKCVCGWKGAIDGRHLEPYDELCDFKCPSCDTMLVIISWPTEDEIQSAATHGNEEAHGQLEQILRYRKMNK